MKPLLIFAYGSMFSVLVPLGTGLLFWKSFQGPLKLILWIVIASASADVISLILMSNKINTWPVGNLFLIIQFILLFKVFNDQIKNTALRIFFFACLAFAAFNFLVLQTPLISNSYTYYACGILMILSALSFLYHLLNEMPVQKVQALPLFWLAFGVLVYYGGTLFLFLFNNYLMTHLPQIHQNIWVLHNLLNISKNVFFFVTLWISYKSKTSQL